MNVSMICIEFMAKLLIADSAQRLGFKSDFNEIIKHPWLSDIDIGQLRARAIDLPYKPKVGDQQLNEVYFSLE
jgi:hypothetical protein